MDKTARTIASYNASAAGFAEKFMDFPTYREKILLFQQTCLAEAETVLDLGCGPGNLAKILHDSNPAYRITGIDLSEEMVILASRNVPGGTFLCADIRQLDLTETFDAVLASFCIMHLDEQETRRFVKRLGSLLNPNGALYLSFIEGNGGGFETTSFSEKQIYFHYYRQTEVIDLLTGSELIPQQIFREDYREQDGSLSREVFVFARKTSADEN